MGRVWRWASPGRRRDDSWRLLAIPTRFEILNAFVRFTLELSIVHGGSSVNPKSVRPLALAGGVRDLSGPVPHASLRVCAEIVNDGVRMPW